MSKDKTKTKGKEKKTKTSTTEIHSDVQGSYTGIPEVDRYPVQDADDL